MLHVQGSMVTWRASSVFSIKGLKVASMGELI